MNSSLDVVRRLAACLVLVVACGADKGDGSGGSGNGTGTGGTFMVDFPDELNGSGGAGQNSSGGADEKCGQLIAILRDFKDSHEDFENDGYNNGLVLGMVEDTLDSDRLPVLKSHSPKSVTSQDTFSQWYRDVPGVNQKISFPLNLVPESPGVFAFENSSFFPLDGKAFGNEGREHNFHFTSEIRGRFKYMGGERFTFKGDDDVWGFVNGKLALDLGGVHGVKEATINFDAQKDRLGIEVGKTYSFDIFHAERHTTRSNFRMETSIECLAVTIL